MPNFILIDGSYYCFYRYFAIEQWFRLAKKDEKDRRSFPKCIICREVS